MSVFTKFKIKENTIFLNYPKEKDAKSLYQVINVNRNVLSYWLPWVKKTKSIKSEVMALRKDQLDLATHKALTLIIVSENQPIGMIDVHNIDPINQVGEIGYWLSSKYQGRGIMTTTVKVLVTKVFYLFPLHKLVIKVASINHKSKAVAKRAGFIHETRLKKQFFRNKDFLDVDIYSILNKKETSK